LEEKSEGVVEIGEEVVVVAIGEKEGEISEQYDGGQLLGASCVASLSY